MLGERPGHHEIAVDRLDVVGEPDLLATLFEQNLTGLGELLCPFGGLGSLFIDWVELVESFNCSAGRVFDPAELFRGSIEDCLLIFGALSPSREKGCSSEQPLAKTLGSFCASHDHFDRRVTQTAAPSLERSQPPGCGAN